MLSREASIELLEYILDTDAQSYLSGARSLSSIPSEQIALIQLNMPLPFMLEMLNVPIDQLGFEDSSINSALLLMLLALVTSGGQSTPLEDSFVAAQVLSKCITRCQQYIDLIICTLMSSVSSCMTFLEQSAAKAKAQRKSHGLATQTPSRRASQSIGNTQSSLSGPDEEDIILDMDQDHTEASASPATAHSSIVSIFSGINAYFSLPDLPLPTQSTVLYLRSSISEIIARLLNKPIKHLPITGNSTMILITTAIQVLETLFNVTEAYHGVLTYDFCRLLVLNPGGKHKVVSSLAADSVTLIQTLCHNILCRICAATIPSDPSPVIEVGDNWFMIAIPILQFSLLSIHHLSAIRLCGSAAVTKLLVAFISMINDNTSKDTDLRLKRIECLLARLIAFFQAIVHQGKITSQLVIIDTISSFFNSKELCAVFFTLPHLLESICLDILFPLVCTTEDTVAASALSMIARPYSDKTVSNFLIFMLYPLCLAFTLVFRSNIKLHLIIPSITLRKATTLFFGKCIIYNTSQLIDRVTPHLEHSLAEDVPVDTGSGSASSSREDSDTKSSSNDPLSLSMLEAPKSANSTSDFHQDVLNFLRDTLSERAKKLLVKSAKQLSEVMTNIQGSTSDDSIRGIVLDELSIRCQDISPVLRKLAINTMLECANVMPLSLWFECIFNLNNESLDTSASSMLDHIMKLLVQPILGCIEYMTIGERTESYTISSLFGGILFHLAAKYGGSEQCVTITSLSYTIRDTLRIHSLSNYLSYLNCHADALMELTHRQQVVCGTLVLAIGCTFMLICSCNNTLVVDSTVTSWMQFSHIASIAATGSIGPVMLATIRNPVLSNDSSRDTIDVGLSYLFLTCITLLSDCLLNEDPRGIKQLMSVLDFNTVCVHFVNNCEKILTLLTKSDQNLTINAPGILTDKTTIILRNLVEGLVCFLRIYSCSDGVSLNSRCTMFLMKCASLIESSMIMLYVSLPSVLSHAATNINCPVARRVASLQATRADGPRFFLSLNYAEAALGHVFCLSRILRIYLPAEKLPEALLEVREALSYIQSIVFARLEHTAVYISNILQLQEQPSLSLVIQQLTEALDLSSSEVANIHDGIPSECQLMFHIVRDLASESLIEPLHACDKPEDTEELHFFDICLGTSSMLDSFLAQMLKAIQQSTDKDSISLHPAIQLIRLYENVIGTLISSIGYSLLRINMSTSEQLILTHVSYLIQMSLKSCSPSARNNSILSVMSLCYLAPDTVGGYILLLVANTRDYSLLIRRQMVLVISDLLLKEYIRKEPAILLALYALIAREESYEFRLFARRVCIEPLLRKAPNLIVHSLMDIVLMLSNCRHFERDPLGLVEQKLTEIIDFSVLDDVPLQTRLEQSLTIQSTQQRHAFYVFLLGFATPPKRFEILSFILKEFLDKIDDLERLTTVHDAVYDTMQLLLAGIFDYKVDTLVQQLPESQASQEDALTSEKAAIVASIIMRLSNKYSIDRLLPALLRIYSLCRDGRLPLAIKVSHAIHFILHKSGISLTDLKEGNPQFGAELIELQLLHDADTNLQVSPK